nr:immunoglobulin heavy chain junction region [Macaca mulatta]MOX58531.1 immunoglobulin heavy chain junction region [Macaca mulatta]MOX58658.1 immunoglobulin heavy chain junction region [Macaca mulatta]MOX59171.1 immunoglobulin heavy chain junction region [Macaca mulatta]MOX59277.1 immunoglobulin heavy chain junction region [Macaca mulatta]
CVTVGPYHYFDYW